MTDQKINEAVAKKLGWKAHPDPHYGSIVKRSDGSSVMFGSMPDFCHDIGATWAIAEKFAFRITREIKPHDHGFWYRVQIYIGPHENVCCCDDQAARALCLAFLKVRDGV